MYTIELKNSLHDGNNLCYLKLMFNTSNAYFLMHLAVNTIQISCTRVSCTEILEFIGYFYK